MNDNTKDLSDGFFKALIGVAARIGAQPLDMLKVMMSESGVRATAKNPYADANGLIQFMGNTLKGLGWDKGGEEFRKLSAEEQVPYVEKYYRPWVAHGLETPARLYLATFLPALLANRESHKGTFVLCGVTGPMAWAYAANKVFDHDKKGYTTVDDLAFAIERSCKGPRWNEIATRLLEAQNMCDEIERTDTAAK